MQKQSLGLRALPFAAGVALLALSGSARADHDPPSRVARLGYLTGQVSFSAAGERDWEEARVNRPLTNGDRLWSDAGSRAEVQVGGAMIRMSAGAGLSILNLDDEIAQLRLTEGRLNVRVRHLDRDQVFEIDTPNLALTIRQPAEFRIEVDPDGDATTIIVRRGEGEVYGDGEAYAIDASRRYRFTGTALREDNYGDDYRGGYGGDYRDHNRDDYGDDDRDDDGEYDSEYGDPPPLDDFDRWSRDRDRRYDDSPSARYVSRDVIGYQDLDEYGSWRSDRNYGYVWTPTRVSRGWAPYRDGRWAWIDPWGWTWVDDAPWGFAVSHYGRWTHIRGSWCWVPGPVRSRAYYAPALVAFVGGSNFQLSISSRNVGGVAWFPLGPREVYRPSYRVSRGYFDRVNRSNTVINTTVINNYYDNSNTTNVVYVNRRVRGAVIAVPRTAFVESQQVARSAVLAPRAAIDSGPVDFVPRVAPTERSVRGGGARRERPPARVFERPVVARRAPPDAHVGFAAQQQQLRAQPGKPLDETARKRLRRGAEAPAPIVKVVRQTDSAPPTVRPPRAERRPNADRGRGRGDDERPAAQSPAQREAKRRANGLPQVAAPPPENRVDAKRNQSTEPLTDEELRNRARARARARAEDERRHEETEAAKDLSAEARAEGVE